MYNREQPNRTKVQPWMMAAGLVVGIIILAILFMQLQVEREKTKQTAQAMQGLQKSLDMMQQNHQTFEDMHKSVNLPADPSEKPASKP